LAYVSPLRRVYTILLVECNTRCSRNGGWDIGMKASESAFRISEDGSSANTRLIILDGGNVGIGTTDPAGYKLYVNGSMYASSYGGSDIRWKKNIKPIDNALSLIRGLQGVSFDWRTDEFKDKNFDTGRQVGLIAQDVEKVIPEIVKTDTQGYKAVSYEKLTAVLVEAVKELKTENSELKNRIAALEAKIK